MTEISKELLGQIKRTVKSCNKLIIETSYDSKLFDSGDVIEQCRTCRKLSGEHSIGCDVGVAIKSIKKARQALKDYELNH